MTLQVPLLDAAAVDAALPLTACMAAMQDALRALDAGRALQPVRTVLHLPDGSGSLYTMPAVLSDPKAMAVKLITIFHGNEGTALPSHQGLVVVFDPATGQPVLLLDAARLTALRTAAVSAVATAVLAREDAADAAILGTGVQARSHAEALLSSRPLRQLRLWGRSAEQTERLGRNLRDFVRAGATMQSTQPAGQTPASTPDIVVCDSAEAAVRGADIICTTTAAREPVLRGEWLKPGAHVNAIGSSTAAARELDSEAVARSRIFVDSIDAAAVEAGDLLIPLSEGRIAGADTWTALGAVLNGRAAGRTGPDEITLFKSVGLAVEDAAAAAVIAARYSA